MMIEGIHHITLLGDHASEAHRFFHDTLGLRLVKQTVNHDDPTTHHLYFGNDTGTPGTLVTVFPYPGLPRAVHGAGAFGRTVLAVPEGSLDFWAERLKQGGIEEIQSVDRAGERALFFRDPSGSRWELSTGASPAFEAPEQNHAVPAEYAIRGIPGVVARVPDPDQTGAFLRKMLGFTLTGSPRTGHHRWAFGSKGRASWIDLATPEADRRARVGSGSTHHLAFRVPNEEVQDTFAEQLRQAGHQVNGPVDRTYFRSIYFPVPGGLLFEIATDCPGFLVDEKPDHLGKTLQLPGHLKDQRASIESNLPPLEF